MARILKCYFFLILTDMYGDIPYFEAEQGYITGNVTPKFDEQELIYKDMHKELLEAEEQLDENADKLTGDIIYSGDLKKWRKFANTLNLRIAMRLVKVAPELAEEWVTAICNIESGLLGAGDDALIHYMDLLDYTVLKLKKQVQEISLLLLVLLILVLVKQYVQLVKKKLYHYYMLMNQQFKWFLEQILHHLLVKMVNL